MSISVISEFILVLTWSLFCWSNQLMECWQVDRAGPESRTGRDRGYLGRYLMQLNFLKVCSIESSVVFCLIICGLVSLSPLLFSLFNKSRIKWLSGRFSHRDNPNLFNPEFTRAATERQVSVHFYVHTWHGGEISVTDQIFSILCKWLMSL